MPFTIPAGEKGRQHLRSVVDDMLDEAPDGQKTNTMPGEQMLSQVVFFLLDNFKYSLKMKVDIYSRLGYSESEILDVISGKAIIGAMNRLEYIPSLEVGGQERK